jgi:hypothetical protein
MMYGISTALMQSLDMDELGERILESVFSCLSANESGALVLIDQDTGEHTRVISRSRKDGGKGDVSYSHQSYCVL